MKAIISLSGSNNNYTPTAAVQQVSVINSPANNANFSRAIQVSQDVVKVVRVSYGVCFKISELVALAIAYEPNLTYAPIITTDPADLTDESNTSSSFTVVANSETTPTYQWEKSTDSGATYSTQTNTGVYSGATTDTLSISDNTGLGGNYYRVVVTNPTGSDTSTGAVLHLSPGISTQPISHVEAAPNPTSFIVVAEGEGSLAYQWQLYNGATWDNLTNTGVYTTVTTATLNISDCTGLNGKQYRVVVTNAYGSKTSNSATLTVT